MTFFVQFLHMLTHFDPIFTCFTRFFLLLHFTFFIQCLNALSHFKPFWAILAYFEQIWPVLTRLRSFGPVLTRLTRFDHFYLFLPAFLLHFDTKAGVDKESSIRETPNLSTDANRSKDTEKKTGRGSPVDIRPSTNQLNHFVLHYAKLLQDLNGIRRL